jgi:hypothetical protein
VLGLAALAWSPLAAQEPGKVRVRQGDWVRVRRAGEAGGGIEGRVWAIERDTLVLADRARSWERSVTLGSLRSLEVRRDHGNYAVTGALVGAGLGVSAGLLFGIPFCSGADTVCNTDEYLRIITYLVLPPIAVGTLVGLMIPRREWEAVPLDRVRLGHRPGVRGAIVTLSLAF